MFCADRNRSARSVMEETALDAKPASARVTAPVAVSAKTSRGEFNRVIPTRPVSTAALNDLCFLHGH